jgi:membrane protein YdbS with pleckstrin-like domain
MDLRPPSQRVSPRAKRYWALRAAAGWLVIAAFELIMGLTNAWPWLGDALPVVLPVTVIGAVAHVTVMPRWRFHVHRWESTDTAVYTQSGWFDQERRIAPLSRIQTVDTERGPLEQVFSLATVTVTTASAAGPLKIHGLDDDVAQALVDRLTKVAAAARDDAT